MFIARRFFPFFILLLLGLSPAAFGQNAPPGMPIPQDELDSARSQLIVYPEELNLGDLNPGDEAKRIFYLNNVGSGTPEWFAEAPAGWTLSDSQNLSGVAGPSPLPLRIHLSYVRETGTSKSRSCSLILRLEAGGQTAVFRREAPVGEMREQIRFHYDGGTASVFYHCKLGELFPIPFMEVDPLRLDFGTVRADAQVTKRILLKNRGREALKWRAGIGGGKGMPPIERPPEGRYISFRNVIAGGGPYAPGGPGREGIELDGSWEEEGGYPAATGEQNVMRFRFTGTGIALYYWKSPDGGPFSVFFDEQWINLAEGHADRLTRAEILLVEEQPDGPHLLSIVNGQGKVMLEGVRIFGKPTQRGPRGWISVFPDSGFTTREIDYINVVLNPSRLSPGVYGEHIVFTSNGGEADVEVFLEVAAEKTPQFLAVQRYLAGSDYLYTTNPKAEAQRLKSKGYQYLGIAFQLFAPGTPGTTEFYRWFNPTIGDHYYSFEPKGDKPLPGYLYEGPIGNIATSRLSGTRELYRWFNPTKGTHFYTTNQTGEGIAKKGYRFDGIAGFVH